EVFVLLQPRPPTSPLFPYTTLFRSDVLEVPLALHAEREDGVVRGAGAGEVGAEVARRQRRDDARAAILPQAAGQVLADDLQAGRSEEHTSELQSRENLVCRLLLEKK